MKILIDFLKVLRFHSYQSILAVLQPEIFYLCKPLILAKLLRSQSIRQNHIAKSRNNFRFRVRISIMIFVLMFADQFIQTKVTKWKKWDFENKDLWEQFRDDFEEWTKTTFKEATIDASKALRAYLRQRDVWVVKYERKTTAKSLHDVLQKETKTFWIEEEIKRCILTEHFTFNRIELLLEIEFDRKSKNYSWQAAKREQLISSRFSKFFQTSQNSFRKQSNEQSVSSRSLSYEYSSLIFFSSFDTSTSSSSVFNRQLCSRLSLISLYRRSLTSSLISFRSTHLSPQIQLEEQSDDRSDEQSDEQLDEQSENQSTDRQSSLITENLKHLDESLNEQFLIESSVKFSVESSIKFSHESWVKLSVESSVKFSVESSVKSLVKQSSFKLLSLKSQERLVKRSNESSISSSSSLPRIAPSIPVNQSGGQPRILLMRQLIRLAKFIKTAIHVRCDIEWIKRSLLNDTRQWLTTRWDELIIFLKWSQCVIRDYH